MIAWVARARPTICGFAPATYTVRELSNDGCGHAAVAAGAELEGPAQLSVRMAQGAAAR
jgi:hypothetical protein